MEIELYLQRIHSMPPIHADLAYLTYLQRQHMLHVPFENIDVTRQQRIFLNVDNFFHKVVARGRGGFCYELNGLFHSLLKQLGYKAQLVGATVWHTSKGVWKLEDTHAAILVELDETYLVDVGFGDTARQPVALTGRTAEDISGAYRVVPDEEVADEYRYERRTDEGWVSLYRFSPQPKPLEQFTVMCDYNQTSPDSAFTQRLIATIAKADGRVTLSGPTLTVTKHGHKTKTEIPTEQTEAILQTQFGITE